jgi:hypothetical protein
MFPETFRIDVRIITEGLWNSPDSFRPVPPFDEHALCEVVHTIANIFEHALAVIATTVAVVRRAYRATKYIHIRQR